MNEILECKENYGRLPPCHRTILLEFVSANPTGPLHIGHGRAAAYGDSLANILAFAAIVFYANTMLMTTAGRRIF